MNIDIQLVHQLIASQFPKWADLFIKQIIPGGHDNRVGGASRLRPLTPPYVRCRIRRF